MELTLIRACFRQNTMAQLYMNDELLCICIAMHGKKACTPLAAFPDGRYCLRNAGESNEEWDLEITLDNNLKPLLMKFGGSLTDDPVSYDYDVPLYLTWNDGRTHISELAMKNISQVTKAIKKGDTVYMTINSQTIE